MTNALALPSSPAPLAVPRAASQHPVTVYLSSLADASKRP